MKTSFPNDGYYCIITVKADYSDGFLGLKQANAEAV